MSDLVKMTYQPGEGEVEGQNSQRNPSSNSMEESFNSAVTTEYDSDSDDGTTETANSEEEDSVKEESPFVLNRSSYKPEKLTTGNNGTPGLSDSVFIDADETVTSTDTPRGTFNGATPVVANALQQPSESNKTPSNPAENSTDKKKSGANDSGTNVCKKPKSAQFSVSEEDGEVRISDYKFVNRIAGLPIVRSALHVYEAAKDLPCVGMAMTLSEVGANLALSPVMFVGAPLASVCSTPINCVDNTLCMCLDVAEAVFPCLKMTPGQIVGAATSCAVNCVCCLPRAVAGVCGICGGSISGKPKVN